MVEPLVRRKKGTMMGTWGIGVFENDAASDFMYEFIKSDPVDYMRYAFKQSEADYLDYDGGIEILISAAVLDMAHIGTEYPDFDWDVYGPLVEKLKVIAVDALVPSAIEAVDRVLRDRSEICELWEESDSFENWYQVISSISSRLNDL